MAQYGNFCIPLRLLFAETDDGVEVELIEIDRTHYGTKK